MQSRLIKAKCHYMKMGMNIETILLHDVMCVFVTAFQDISKFIQYTNIYCYALCLPVSNLVTFALFEQKTVFIQLSLFFLLAFST